jgi:hypothetical protein
MIDLAGLPVWFDRSYDGGRLANGSSSSNAELGRGLMVIEKLPREIKRPSKADLVTLALRAREAHLGVGRRADWISEHIDGDRVGYLRADLHETSPQPCFRCLVLAPRFDGSSEHFSLDVLPADFEALSTASSDVLLRLARLALDRVPVDPLPAEYQAEWDAHRGNWASQSE